MKLLSFNCRGLASPSKKSALKRLVTLHQPDVFFLQETLTNERSATQALMNLFPGWAFLGLDASGISRGLVTGWNSRKIKPLNSWASDSCLGLEVLVEGLGMTLNLLNIYGPNTDRIHFWNTLFKKDLLREENLIIVGDLNFSLGEAESWGSSTHLDPQDSFFSHLLATNGLIDIVPTKLIPTWRNLRTEKSHVAKKLDRFLVTETISLLPLQFLQWIGSGGDSNHSLG
jgi:exonuclease III